jgi:hypothetical protein
VALRVFGIELLLKIQYHYYKSAADAQLAQIMLLILLRAFYQIYVSVDLSISEQ